jgi:hypothetical protein
VGGVVLTLSEVFARPVLPLEEQRYCQLMREHHYLGALPKISETLWYVAVFGEQWIALLSFSAPALKVDRMELSLSIRPAEVDYQ